MDIGKAQWDRYVETKRDLVALEREHADLEERMQAARRAVETFEQHGIRYDPERAVICIGGRRVSLTR